MGGLMIGPVNAASKCPSGGDRQGAPKSRADPNFGQNGAKWENLEIS